MNTYNEIKPGDHVAWKWANGIAEGIIVRIYNERTEIVSKEKRIVRNGTSKNPALIIKHTSGSKVLKLLSEIQLTRVDT